MPREPDLKRACTPHPAGSITPPAGVFPLIMSPPHTGFLLTTNPVFVFHGTRQETPLPSLTQLLFPPGALPLTHLWHLAAQVPLRLALPLCLALLLERVETLMVGAQHGVSCHASFLDDPAKNRALPLHPVQLQGLLTPFRRLLHRRPKVLQIGKAQTPSSGAPGSAGTAATLYFHDAEERAETRALEWRFSPH